MLWDIYNKSVSGFEYTVKEKQMRSSDVFYNKMLYFVGSFMPQRYVVCIMGMLGTANAYTMRVCLNLAITQMVNDTVMNTEHFDPNACPSDEVIRGVSSNDSAIVLPKPVSTCVISPIVCQYFQTKSHKWPAKYDKRLLDIIRIKHLIFVNLFSSTHYLIGTKKHKVLFLVLSTMVMLRHKYLEAFWFKNLELNGF